MMLSRLAQDGCLRYAMGEAAPAGAPVYSDGAISVIGDCVRIDYFNSHQHPQHFRSYQAQADHSAHKYISWRQQGWLIYLIANPGNPAGLAVARPAWLCEVH